MLKVRLICPILTAVIIFSPSILYSISLEEIKEDIKRTTQLLQEEKMIHQKEKEQAASAQRSLEERIKILKEKIEEIELENKKLEDEISNIKSTQKELMKKKENIDNFFSNVRDSLYSNAEWLEKTIESSFPYIREDRLAKIREFEKKVTEEEHDLVELTRELYYYFIKEIELGYDSEIYSEEIETEKGEMKKAKFLRVGKILLAYRTNDSREAGFWIKNKWERDLPSYFKKNVTKAIEIMEGKRIPKLLELPILLNYRDYKEK